MPTSDYKYPVEFLVSDPASQVLSALESWSAKADLQFLSQSSVQALQEEPGVSRVVLALNSETISLLDSRCLLDGKSLLGVTSDADEGRWRDCDFSWPEDLSGSQLQWGEGKYPGSNVWPEEFQNSSPSESKQCWVRILVMAREIPAMMIVISCKESLQEQPLWGQNMTRLQQVLQMTCNQWLESVALDLQVRNLSDEKQALSRLNRLQGRFVSMASHEFKTPLTSITAYADALLGQKDKQTPVTTEFLGVIRSEAGRLLRMVNRILDFSRMEYGSRLLGGEPKKLIPLIEETLLALKPTMAAKQLDCTLVDKQQIPRVIVDTDLIRQVLVNLIGNAVKFTPEGGCISINLVEVESSVEVQISDNGPGIPQRDIHRIFREFFRSRETASQEEGTGLGLTIVRHIINLHGGYVKARQRIGGGSVFTFGVPKEIHVLGTLPQRYTDRMEVTEAQRMMTAALQLVAETAKVKKVSLLLNDSHGNPRPVLALGLNTNSATSLPQGTFSSWEKIRNPELSAERADLDWSWHPDGEPEKDQTLIVPLWGKNEKQGYLILENPTSGEGFESSAKVQAMILARVTVMALRVLYERSGQTENISGLALVAKTTEALRTLIQIRRNGVPTAEAEALEMLGDLARSLNLPEDQVADLLYAAALHDAGMARVEDEILLGETELSFDERDEVDRHVEQGVDLMSPLMPASSVAEIIRHHHERFDGSGYPDGKRGEEIPLGSRLLAVIDTWFSLTRGRSFRAGLPASDALSEIRDNSATQFDPEVVSAFGNILKNRDYAESIPYQHGPSGFGI